MSDVRLTATNPEDSSVVPVACNSRGELLITEPVIEQIDNDVTINGTLNLDIDTTSAGNVAWSWTESSGAFHCYRGDLPVQTINLKSSGEVTLRRFDAEDERSVTLDTRTYAMSVFGATGSSVYTINWNGNATGANFFIALEPDNPVHYSSVRNVETGEETKEYIGPVMKVREELDFLRVQVRALMERLKMTPEGGWPVWDGSDE